MAAFSEKAEDYIQLIKGTYQGKVTDENQFLVTLIADIMAKIDELQTDVKTMRDQISP